MVKNTVANAGDMGWIQDLGDPWPEKIPNALEHLSLSASTIEPVL